jgi:hypothetical protein
MRTSGRLCNLHPCPPQFGRYPLLHHFTAMTTYPDIRHVPTRIPRPRYVPRNFFDVSWGDHETAEDDVVVARGARLSKDGIQGVRNVGRMASEVLKEVGELIKVKLT